MKNFFFRKIFSFCEKKINFTFPDHLVILRSLPDLWPHSKLIFYPYVRYWNFLIWNLNTISITFWSLTLTTTNSLWFLKIVWDRCCETKSFFLRVCSRVVRTKAPFHWEDCQTTKFILIFVLYILIYLITWRKYKKVFSFFQYLSFASLAKTKIKVSPKIQKNKGVFSKTGWKGFLVIGYFEQNKK